MAFVLKLIVRTAVGYFVGDRIKAAVGSSDQVERRGVGDRASTLAAAVGKGLAAGLVGTAAMTVSSTLEAKLRDRGASTTPAKAASQILGVEPTEEGEKRFNNLVHWGYGTGWGAVRGILGALGLSGAPATAAHLAAVWGGEQIVLPATGASPSAVHWGAKEIAIDLGHHAVYAVATGAAYSWLDRD